MRLIDYELLSMEHLFRRRTRDIMRRKRLEAEGATNTYGL